MENSHNTTTSPILEPGQKFNILSPDGFTISHDKQYSDIEEAKENFEQWKERFKSQGYYSSNKGQIPLIDLESYCTLVIEPDNQLEDDSND